MEIISATDIAKKIGLKNIHQPLASVPNDMKLYLPKKDSIGRKILSVYLTKEGVRCLLYKSRKANIVSIASEYGINLKEIYRKSIERSTLDAIKTVFSGEEMIEQYSVNSGKKRYSIDLYFPKFCIAVECDEELHKRFQIEDDIRQKKNCKKVECTFRSLSTIHGGFQY